LGPYHPWIAPRAINLGRTYQQFDRIVEAEELLRVALDQDRHIYGESHQYVASSLQNLAILIYNEKDKTEGMQLIEQGLAIEEQAIGKEHINTNQTRALLASYYTEAGLYDEAEALLDEAEVVFRSSFDNDHIYLADLAKFRGQLYVATERAELAVAELTSSAAMFERLFDSDSERLPEVLISLADAYSTIGESENAISAYSRGLSILENGNKATDEHYKRLEELKSASSTLPEQAISN
ncbi:MAG: tetratricopeptide repeat protein, partial [Woeseiaceae bacterium]